VADTKPEVDCVYAEANELSTKFKFFYTTRLLDIVRINAGHVLYPLLPAKTEHRYNLTLTKGRHDYELTTKTPTLNDNHFTVYSIW